jgi:hypothetical protein
MWKKIKELAIELAQWAEKELKGKTGAEKRAAVVGKMCAVIDIPFIPDWLEGMFEPILYGWIVDNVCNFLNILTEHDIAGVELTPEQIAKVAELIAVTPAGESVLPDERELPDKVIEDVATAGGIDAKLAALYEKYGNK